MQESKECQDGTRTMGGCKEEKYLKIYQVRYCCRGGPAFEHPGTMLVVAGSPLEALQKVKREKLPALWDGLFEYPERSAIPLEDILRKEYDENYKIIIKRTS